LAFVDGHVLGLVAFDKVLGLVFRGMMDVAVDRHIGDDFLEDDAADSSGFRILLNMVTALKGFRHCSDVPPGCSPIDHPSDSSILRFESSGGSPSQERCMADRRGSFAKSRTEKEREDV
jgi:hypothetical protein